MYAVYQMPCPRGSSSEMSRFRRLIPVLRLPDTATDKEVMAAYYDYLDPKRRTLKRMSTAPGGLRSSSARRTITAV